MALVLALTSNAALALGLGDIRVLSRPGQPLLAEIPVVSADAGELEAARVALASPATFARVGLERPTGLVSTLQFDFAQDSQGRAVIRVRSDAPVDTAVVSFLIEVDWGRGRLVREYSALIDRPQTATAVNQPQIEAPQVAPSNQIVREATLAATPTAAPAPAVMPAPVPAAAAPAAASRPAVAAVPAAPAAVAGQTLTVQSGQTLSHIASQLTRGGQANMEQAMIALLQANPQAFIGGNIHRLRSGAQLDLPDAQSLSAIGAAQARAMVSEQTTQWRQARAPVQQPELSMTSATATAVTPDKPAAPTDAAPATQGARLEIAPAVASDGSAQASVSGTVAGADGDRLVSEQLRQAKEDLVTRDAEIAELRERVAELESLRQQQQSLIELKDNEMATAQKHMAERPVASDGAAGSGWLWGGGLLLVGAALVAWLVRRRKPSPLPPLSASALDDADTQADPAPAPAAPGLDAEQMIRNLSAAHPAPAPLDQPSEQGVDEPQQAPELHVEREPDPVTPAVLQLPVADQALVLDAGERFDPFAPPAEERAADADQAPPLAHQDNADDQPLQAALEPSAWSVAEPADAVDSGAATASSWQSPQSTGWAADLAASEPLQPLPGSRERLELAIAYLDLGDADTARTLLEEVVAGGDRASREQAMELLGRLA